MQPGAAHFNMVGSPVEGEDVWDVKMLLEVHSKFTPTRMTLHSIRTPFLPLSLILMIFLFSHSKQFSVDIAEHAPKVCLAHLFTYQDFEGGTLGLAYVAPSRPGVPGGLCSESKPPFLVTPG